MKNLMSMVDYCQQVSSEFMSPKKPFDKNEWFGKILNYSDFLKQPLELWMFVPCDEDGNVLNPLKFTLDGCPIYNGGTKFQQAKERCLFDGFEYQQAQQEDHYSLIRFPDRRTTPLYPKLWIGMTIEDLVKYNLQLTPTVIKQLDYER